MKTVNIRLKLNKKYFPLSLHVKWLDRKRWALLSDFEYHRDNGIVIRAEKDFITDFGSKPWWSWSLVGSPTDEASPAYIIHDWLCYKKPYSYSKIDYIFYEAMSKCGVAYLKRTVMYWAVKMWHLFKS